MGGLPDTLRLISPQGEAREVPIDQVPDAIAAGFRVEAEGEQFARLREEQQAAEHDTLGSKIAAGVAGLARGVTLGGSDVAVSLIGTKGDVDTLRELQEAHPTISAGTELVGGVAPALVGAFSPSGAAGALARATPAGFTADIGAKVVAAGRGGSTARAVAAGVAGGAIEGGAQNAGHYLSEVALGNRPLSAEGFVGAMGQGALFGGAAGGTFALGERALTNARRLFPRSEVTREAADEAERAAVSEIDDSMRDAENMATLARDRLRQIRQTRAEMDLELKAKLDDIKITEARKLSELRVAREAAKGTGKRSRRAMGGGAKLPATSAEVTDGMTMTIPSAELKARGFEQMPGVGDDAVKMDKARKAIAEGQKSPAIISIEPSGKIHITDGRHRIAAAIEAGKPIKVKINRAVDTRPGATSASDLEAALAATKARLDDGKSLAELSARPPARAIEDALDDAVAAVDPEAQALVQAERTWRKSKAEVDEWIKGLKAPSEAERGTRRSYVETQTGEAARGIGPRKLDRIETPIGTPEAEAKRAAWFDREAARPTLAEEILKHGNSGRFTSDEIVDITRQEIAAREQAAAIADKIRAGLRGTSDNLGADLTRATEVIGAHERASAELAAALGEAAPPTATRRAVSYRSAVDAQGTAMGQAAARAGEEGERALAGDLASAAARGQPTPRMRLLGHLADAGGAMEVMRDLGLPVPDPRAVPVIGPVLGLYLKARGYSAVFRRLGGKMPATAETLIAERSAGTRDRVRRAVGAALEVAERGVRRAAPAAPSTAAILSRSLFDDRVEEPRRRKVKLGREGTMADVQALYRERIAELAKATGPGAIRDAVLARVRASDPAINEEIASTVERKLQFLNEKAPKFARPPSLAGSDEMGPSKAELAKFARYVEAAEDPAGVIERMAATGEISLEAVETIRVVYPQLYNEARTVLAERLIEQPDAIPYTRRIMLSVLFDVPVDPSADPDYIRFLQSGYETAPATPAAPPMPAPGAPPAPAVPALAGDVMLGQRAMMGLDQRGGM